MICCRSPAARGVSEDGSSECLYCSFPGWSVFLAGPPQPRIFTNGGSTPGPRVTFVRTKVTKKRWGTPRPPLFIQSVCIEADTSQPPNYHTLRASDLRRVSGRTSAVALLKGQANLIFCVGPPAPIGPCTGFRHQKIEMSLIPRAVRRSGQRTAPITRGQRRRIVSVAAQNYFAGVRLG